MGLTFPGEACCTSAGDERRNEAAAACEWELKKGSANITHKGRKFALQYQTRLLENYTG